VPEYEPPIVGVLKTMEGVPAEVISEATASVLSMLQERFVVQLLPPDAIVQEFGLAERVPDIAGAGVQLNTVLIKSLYVPSGNLVWTQALYECPGVVAKDVEGPVSETFSGIQNGILVPGVVLVVSATLKNESVYPVGRVQVAVALVPGAGQETVKFIGLGTHDVPLQVVPAAQLALTVIPEPFGEVGTSDLELLER